MFMFYNVPLFFGQFDILHEVYGLTFANSANNTSVINTFNVQNRNITKVHNGDRFIARSPWCLDVISLNNVDSFFEFKMMPAFYIWNH